MSSKLDEVAFSICSSSAEFEAHQPAMLARTPGIVCKHEERCCTRWRVSRQTRARRCMQVQGSPVDIEVHVARNGD